MSDNNGFGNISPGSAGTGHSLPPRSPASPSPHSSNPRRAMSEFDFVDEYAAPQEAGSLLGENTATTALNCAFVGVGGGGGKLAKSFLDAGFTKTMLVNTTAKDFANGVEDGHLLPLPGLDGVAKDVGAGEQALHANSALVEDAIRTRFGKVDWLFVCASGGGGTGSSAFSLDPAFQRYLESVEAEGKVVYIVTKPTAQELLNNTIKENYAHLLAAVQGSTYLLLDNERQLNHLRGRVGVSSLYPAANKMFARMWCMVLKLASESSSIQTFDSKDLSRFLSQPGRLAIGSVKADPSTNLGATLYQGCINGSPCPSPDSQAEAGFLLEVISQEMADDPTISTQIEAASSYVGGRCATLFTGIYVRDTPSLVSLMGLGGLK